MAFVDMKTEDSCSSLTYWVADLFLIGIAQLYYTLHSGRA